MPTSIATYYIDEYVLDRYLILYERDSFYNDRRSSQSTDVQAVVDRTGPDLPDLPDRFGIRFGSVRFGIFLKYQTGLF